MNGMRLSVISLMVLSMAAVGTGCKKKGGNNAASDAGRAVEVATPAFVRVVNGAAAGSVDIAVNGINLASGLNQNAFVRERVPFPAGSATVQVTAGGSSVASANVSVNAGQNYTFVVLGNASSGYQGVLYNDDLGSAAGKNRFIHGMPAVGAVTLTADNGTELASGLNYRAATSFLSVPANLQRVSIRTGGNVMAVDAVPNNAARAITTVLVPKGAGAHYINVVDRTN